MQIDYDYSQYKFLGKDSYINTELESIIFAWLDSIDLDLDKVFSLDYEYTMNLVLEALKEFEPFMLVALELDFVLVFCIITNRFLELRKDTV